MRRSASNCPIDAIGINDVKGVGALESRQTIALAEAVMAWISTSNAQLARETEGGLSR
jgi:hypothetical protein